MSNYEYKMVDGELVALTPEEIAELEERDKQPPPVDPNTGPDALTLAKQANERLNRGIEVGKEGLDKVDQEIDALGRMRRTVNLEDLQTQIVDLISAVRGMLTAQQAFAPAPVSPVPPVTKPAPKRGARP